MKKLTAMLLLILVSNCAEDDAIRFSGGRQPIIGGAADTNMAHMAVVAIMDNYGLCTATLISPTVLLTAAHCAQSAARSYTVSFGNNLYGATRRAVSEVRPHPQYDDQALKNDIALMRLTTPAPSGVMPIPYLPASIGITVLDIGTQLEFVGFGEDERGGVGAKLTVKNALNWVCGGDSSCSVGGGYYAAPHTICQDQSPGGPCSGDSGGPAFILRDGREFVCGVTSYGDQDCRIYGCSTKVDAFEDFILEWVGKGLGVPCADVGQCDSGYCEQGFCCESECRGECRACNVGGQWGNCVVVPDGTPCEDTDKCNGVESCVGGVCRPGSPPDCDDRNPCTNDWCDSSKGCQHDAVADGTSCRDSNLCNGEEVCQGGVCQAGKELDCNDHNPCTQDVCLPDRGCVNTNVLNGSDCSGGICGTATCQYGVCVPLDASICDDSNPCTSDGCNPELGCVHIVSPEETSCGDCRVCRSGQCVEGECSGCACGSAGSGSRLLWSLLTLMGLGLLLSQGRKQ